MEFIKDKRLNFIISVAIGLVILFYLLSKLQWLFIYFSIALMLAYFFDPLYRYLIHKKIPKVLAIIIVFGIIITLLILTIFFLIPSVINQLNILYKEIPKFIENYQNLILSIKPQLSKFINPADVEILLKENLSELQRSVLGFSQTIIIYLSNIVSSITFGIVIIPLILFYLMRDMFIFKENLYIYVARENKKEFKEVLEEIDHIVSGFIRGRIIVCFIVGTLIGIGLYFLNVEFALIIGIVSGVFNFIPYLGPIVGVVLALIFALGNPWWSLLMIVVLFVLVNQLEAVYLNPNILGKGLGLHPLTVILSMLICGQLLGILGVLVAVPLAAILKVLFFRYLVQEG
ncbi:AI-2E family transporter [bacterium]|nr:AI-2E family transporter [bacterium]MBU4361163.1 AI-2E family transporter [bacterium]MBU4602150.1 AI-2E family transporter [bacterium]MCG2762754.1 AI-2E family transporter [Candidatus Atribacteria bacterium]